MRWKMPAKPDLSVWHPWFAWYPVRLRSAGCYAWLEWLMRRDEGCEVRTWVYTCLSGVPK